MKFDTQRLQFSKSLLQYFLLKKNKKTKGKKEKGTHDLVTL